MQVIASENQFYGVNLFTELPHVILVFSASLKDDSFAFHKGQSKHASNGGYVCLLLGGFFTNLLVRYVYRLEPVGSHEG